MARARLSALAGCRAQHPDACRVLGHGRPRVSAPRAVDAQPSRCARGGRIDRAQPLRFTFNGDVMYGYAGDTLAAALLANGIRLVARSFKYHRPRGIVSAGADEPNALVQLAGALDEPNVRATTLRLFDGLVARSVNCWPGPGFDMGALNSLLSPLLPAGFYYKTFMWPLFFNFLPLLRLLAAV